MALVRRSLVLFAVLAVVATGVLLSMPLWVQPVLHAWLAGQGFDQVSVEMEQPGWDGVDVHHIRLVRNAPAPLSLTARDIRVDFSPVTLVRGYVTRLQVAEAELTVGDDAQSSSPLVLGRLLPANWLGAVPVQHVAVRRLRLLRGTGAPLQLSLYGGLKPAGADFKGTLSAGAGVAWSAVARVGDDGTLAVELGRQDAAPLLTASLKAAARNGRVTLSGSVRARRFRGDELAGLIALPPLLSMGCEVGIEASLPDPLPPGTAALAASRGQGQLRCEGGLERLQGALQRIQAVVQGGVRWDGQVLHWTLAPTSFLSAYPLAQGLPAPLRSVLSPSSRLSVGPGDGLDGTLSRSDDGRWGRLTAHGNLVADMAPPDSPAALTVKLGDPQWRLNDGEFTATLSVTGRLRLALPGPYRRQALAVRAALHHNADTSVFTVQPGSWLQLDDGEPNAPVRGPTKLTLTAPTPLEVAANGDWTLRGVIAKLQLPGVVLDGYSVTADAARLNLASVTAQGGALSGSGTLSTDAVSVAGPDLGIPPTALRVPFSLNHGDIEATPRLGGEAWVPELQANVHHSLDGAAGSLELTMPPQTVGAGGLEPARLWRRWPKALSLDGGRVAATARLRWRAAGVDRDGAEVTVSLDDVGGRYGDSAFSGLTTRATVRDLTNPRTPAPVLVSLRSLDAGVPVTHIGFAALLEPGPRGPLLHLQELGAHLLGGQAHSRSLTLDPALRENRFSVALRGLDLAAVARLEQQQELEVEGVMDGQLPVVVGADGVAVERGRVWARKPGGIVRYRAGEAAASVAASNPNLDLALQALRNFHFRVLEAGVDYGTGGDLKLAISLQGHNPDLNQGQPINFNLNVEENVPTLLHSLRIADRIGDEVGRRAAGQQ